MNFGRKYDTRIPQLNERIHEFVRTKHLIGQVEHEFQSVNEPTLTVDTADPNLHNELDGFISNLEHQRSWRSSPPGSLIGRSDDSSISAKILCLIS
jgi:hypothetical protein